jgi:hypothetical protein
MKSNDWNGLRIASGTTARRMRAFIAATLEEAVIAYGLPIRVDRVPSIEVMVYA